MRLAFAALSFVGLSTGAGSALADQAGAAAPPFVGCQVTVGANGMSLPSNAPALLVNDSSNQAKATVSAELVSPAGRAPLGAPTEDTHGLTVMALPKASAGSHTIATTVTCSNGSPESLQETSLTLTAPVDLPTTVGTLSVRPNPTPNGIERIVLDASPGLRAFKDIAVVALSIDGAVTAGALRGGFAEELSVNTGRVCVENGALLREVRTVRVTVSAHLAGVAESPAAATLDIPVDCGAIRWTTDADFDGATSSNPSSSEPDATTNASSASSASGCSAAPSGLMSESPLAFAATAALALLASLRRRRAR